MHIGEIPFQFQHQSRQRIGIQPIVQEVIVVYIQRATEIHQLRLTLKDIGVV